MRLFMLYLDLDELPELFDGYRRSPRPAGARSPSSAAPTTSATRGVRSPARSARSSRARTGVRRAGPVRLLTNLRDVRARLQPGQLLLLLRRRRASASRRSSPRSPTRPGASATPTCSCPTARARRAPSCAGRSRRSSTSRRSWAWTTPTHWRLTEPGEQLIVHIDSERDGRARLRRHAVAAAPCADARSLARLLARHPLLSAQIARAGSTRTVCVCG